jgi:hypothetical protein
MEKGKMSEVSWSKVTSDLKSEFGEQRACAYQTIIKYASELSQASDSVLEVIAIALIEQREPGDLNGSYCQLEPLLKLEQCAALALLSHIKGRRDLTCRLKQESEQLRARGSWLDWETSNIEAEREMYKFIREGFKQAPE